MVDLGSKEKIRGLKVWNYNESLEDTWTGVKRIRVVVDGTLVTPIEGVLVRKAPGVCRRCGLLDPPRVFCAPVCCGCLC